MLSWAVQGGGRRRADTVAWYRVQAQDLAPPVDPRQFLRQKLLERSIPDAVGLLTSANLDSHADMEKVCEGLRVRALATVGLSNALRVGDPLRPAVPVGTINLLCHISSPLSEEAHLEALSVAVEARSLAVLEASIPSHQTGLPATGTGTDCVVVAAPESSSEVIRYAGKHTQAGHLIGEVVLETMRQGIRLWRTLSSG